MIKRLLLVQILLSAVVFSACVNKKPLKVCPALASGRTAGFATCLPTNFQPRDLGSVVASTDHISFIAFGDQGLAGQSRKVAAGIRQYIGTAPVRPDLGLVLGDNFYPRGIATADSPRWNSDWEQIFGTLVPFYYVVLGNHDRMEASSPYAEILHTDRSNSWRMPAAYYSFKAGPVQFVALDTTPLANRNDDVQKEWLLNTLKARGTIWRIAFGHHPLVSGGKHRKDHEVGVMGTDVRQILEEEDVDLYISGHDHDMEFLGPNLGISKSGTLRKIHAAIAGSGSETRPTHPTPSRETRFCAQQTGFVTVEASGIELKISFVGVSSEARKLYSCTLRKNSNGIIAADCPPLRLPRCQTP